MDRDRLEKMTDPELRQVKLNAVKKNRHDIAAICAEILSIRNPSKNSKGKIVVEFHFICLTGLNLFPLEHGLYKSGQWVVAEKHCKKAKVYGSMVALHKQKSQLSYFQGKILDYRRVLHVETQRWRIEFILDPTSQPLAWYGNAAGERGYRYN
jgi:hypothetical protein